MIKSGSGHTYPWRFLVLTLGITWTFQFGLLVLMDDVPVALALLPSLAPALVALWLLYQRHDAEYRRDYWRRVFEYRRIGWVWWAVILLYYPLKSLVGALIDVLNGGTGIEVELSIEQPLMLVPILIYWLFFGPVPEELGWRGYALDGLQDRMSALRASLILGVIWALWHVPLYFIDGTFQADEVGWLSQRFWIFMLSIVLESILYTWIFNNTNRSTLSAIVFHFVGNAFGESFALSQQAEIYSFGIMIGIVIAVILIWKPGMLTQNCRKT